MFEIPSVQYAECPEGLIAFEVFGDHSIDLVHLGGWAQTSDLLFRPLASQGIEPSRWRSRIAVACSLTSSYDDRSNAHAMDS